MEHLILFFLLALVAEYLGTIGGFGSSLFFVPIASFFFDFQTVLGITAAFHVASNLTKIGFFRKGIDKKILVNLGVPAVVFVIIGASLSAFINTKLLELILALFLIILSIALFTFRNFKLQPSVFNAVSGGTISGFVAGLVGTGGAIRGITLSAFGLSSQVFIATSAVIDLGVDASRTVVYAMNGYMRKDFVYLIPILFGISIIGTYLGKKTLAHISENLFKNIVLFFVFTTGIVTLIRVL